MRVLVTGAAGFLGSHVSEALLARGDEVVGLDAFSADRPRSEREENVAALRRWAGWYFERGDVRDEELVRRLVRDEALDAVVHLARCSHREDPIEALDTLAVGTAAVLDACRRGSVERFVLGSSAAVYAGAAAPFAEDDVPEPPRSGEAAAVRAAERAVHVAYSGTRLDAVILRFFTLVGPRQRGDQAVATFLDRLSRDEPAPVHGGGRARRDVLDVRDAAEATLAALGRTRAGLRDVLTCNVGSGRSISVRELVEHCARSLGVEAQTIDADSPEGWMMETQADPARAARELGWTARRGPEETVQRQADWIRKRRTRGERRRLTDLDGDTRARVAPDERKEAKS